MISINKINHLVLSGGGVKGISFVGALKELILTGLNIDKLTHICGVSAGSIIAALLSVGYNIDELHELMLSIDFAKFVDGNYISESSHFFTQWGCCAGNYFLELMGTLIEKKTGNKNYNFKQLQNDKGISLTIPVTNISTSKIIYINDSCEIFKDIPIKDAIRMSMSIPFLFEPVKYNDHYYVDGGLLDNYPIGIYNNSGEDNVLGIRIITKYDETHINKFNHLYEYAYGFIDTLLFTIEDKNIDHEKNNYRTIKIKTPSYSITKFNITSEEKYKLFHKGEKSVRRFVNN